MKSQVGSIALVALAVLVGGCSLTKICNSTGGMEVAQTEDELARTNVDDPCFREWLAVESAVAVRTANGFLSAQVELRNVRRDLDDDGREDDFDAQYQVLWFDAKGLAVLPDTAAWRRVTWHGGEARPLLSTAPDASAVRYVLRLRHVQ